MFHTLLQEPMAPPCRVWPNSVCCSVRTVSPAAVQHTQSHSSLAKSLLTCCDTKCTTTFSLAFNSPTGLGRSLTPYLKDHAQQDVCGRRDSPRQCNKCMKHTEHVFSQSSSYDSPQIMMKEGDDKGITGNNYKLRGMTTTTMTTPMMMAMLITPMTMLMMMTTPITTITALTMTATMMTMMTKMMKTMKKMKTMKTMKTTTTVTETTKATATKMTATKTTKATVTKIMKATATKTTAMKTTKVTATKTMMATVKAG